MSTGSPWFKLFLFVFALFVFANYLVFVAVFARVLRITYVSNDIPGARCNVLLVFARVLLPWKKNTVVATVGTSYGVWVEFATRKGKGKRKSSGGNCVGVDCDSL